MGKQTEGKVSFMGHEYVILLGPENRHRIIITAIIAIAVSIFTYLVVKNAINEDVASWSVIAVTITVGLFGLTKRIPNPEEMDP